MSSISLKVPSATEQNPQTRVANVPYADVLRVVGAFAVIVIHVTGDGTSAIDTLPLRSWWLCTILESLSRWAVPIFVMVSGMLLLDPNKVESPVEFYRKRMRRLAIPMTFWSIFYLCWRWFYEGERFHAGTAIYQFVSGGGYYHLWFLTMLLGLYLATPVLRIIVHSLSRIQLCWTTATVLALAMADAVARANDGSDFTFVFKFCPFIGLFLLGYCLRDVHRSRNSIPLGVSAWLIGAAISAVGTYILVFHCTTGNWDVDDRLFLVEDEFSPGNLIASMGVFTLFAAWYESKEKTQSGKVIRALSTASLGIYLAHPLFLSILNANDIDYEWHGVAVGIPLMIAVAAVGATTLSLILNKIPFLKQVV
jgi:surface polysaccharide O-acyltransferase-like enzyme